MKSSTAASYSQAVSGRGSLPAFHSPYSSFNRRFGRSLELVPGAPLVDHGQQRLGDLVVREPLGTRVERAQPFDRTGEARPLGRLGLAPPQPDPISAGLLDAAAVGVGDQGLEAACVADHRVPARVGGGSEHGRRIELVLERA